MDDNYMKDPRAKTLGGFIAALQIFAKYTKEGTDEKYCLQGEHDIIYGPCERPEEDSEEGQILRTLGWHFDEEVDSWAYFT